jgi:hypothetical protein
MCANGVDLGHQCRLCGKPLLSCWDDGPSISWHADEADAADCADGRVSEYDLTQPARLIYPGGKRPR